MRAGQFSCGSRSTVSITRVAGFQRILPSIYAGGMVTSKTLLTPNLIRHFHDAREFSLNHLYRQP
jgi:hypothetical protein